MKSLSQQIDESRTIKPNSLRAYIISLKKIHEHLETDIDFNNLDWLDDFEGVEGFLSDFKTTTRKNYLTSIIVALMTQPEDYRDAIDIYRDAMEDAIEEYTTDMSSQKMSSKQAENFISLDVLRCVVNDIGVKASKLLDKTVWGQKDFGLYQEYLVGSLYTILPPVRNDYSNMVVMSFEEYNDTDPTGINALVRTNKRMFFSFGNYKTDNKYGVKIVDIPEDLEVIISIWLDYNETGYFLINNKKNPLSDNSLTKLLNKIFSSTGKKISTTMLRTIYLTEKYPANNCEKVEDARIMGHSVATQQNIYVKKQED
tara:strand:+ start:4689 stop:5627 length:939 start_codon:yes stop_codon:yes gene_type:complete